MQQNGWWNRQWNHKTSKKPTEWSTEGGADNGFILLFGLGAFGERIHNVQGRKSHGAFFVLFRFVSTTTTTDSTTDGQTAREANFTHDST